MCALSDREGVGIIHFGWYPHVVNCMGFLFFCVVLGFFFCQPVHLFLILCNPNIFLSYFFVT